jgi:6-phosphogluconolactonase/glucosamine-6-phosphate isomerase/deaminase
MGLGEAVYGAARGASDVVFITVGTGIGGAMVIDGRLFGGFKNRGAELGHVPLIANGKVCSCGGRGCLELYASTTALVERYAELAGVDVATVTGRTVTAGYMAGESTAMKCMDEHFDHLGHGIAGFVNVFAPQHVIVGGGIAEAGPWYAERLYTAMCHYAMPDCAVNTSVMVASLGNMAGVCGAAHAATLHAATRALSLPRHVPVRPSWGGVTVVSVPTYTALSTMGADVVHQALLDKPDLVLGIATGHSPTGLYTDLARRYMTTPSVFTQLRLVQLDEWVGVGDGPSSCIEYLRTRVSGPLRVAPERVHAFDMTLAPADSAAAMDRALEALGGAIDVLIIGLGVNGHIGFIEPSREWAPGPCFVATLQSTSQQHAMVAAEATKPTHGVTLGLDSIRAARHIILLLTGANKKDAVAKWLAVQESPSTPTTPASLLWSHPRVTAIIDESSF